MPAHTFEITVGGAPASRIEVGRGLATTLPARPDRTTAFMVVQRGEAERVAAALAKQLKDQVRLETAVIPDREESKTWQVVADLQKAFARAELGRHDTVVVVGGGAATDVGGFAAATWLRGIESVYHPTTLLAAVDAAIGGKTGINLAGKNLVGAFWHPALVSIDLDVIERVPEAIQREGHAEAFKAGLIADADLVSLYETHGPDVPLDVVVPAAVAVKAAVVSDDFRETGRRAILNYGHTLGHAIEYCTRLTHGEAVAVGMVAAGAASQRVFGFEHPVVDTLGRLGLPVEVEADPAEVRRLLLRDKKRDAGGIRMVLLRALADPVVQHVDDPVVDEAMAAVGLG